MSGITLDDVMRAAIDALKNEPHETIPGLKRRYYWRGSFVLLEHLPKKGCHLERRTA